MPFPQPPYWTPFAASATVLLTNCAEFDENSPVALFKRASPANSTRGSLIVHSGLVARKSVTTSFVSPAWYVLPAIRMFAVKSLVPSIFQSLVGTQYWTRASQRLMLPVERTAIGQ